VSSRVKDLVDIAIIARTQSMPGPALRTALLTGVAHRDLTLPSRFDVPDIEAWRIGYARRTNDVPGQSPSFEEAIDLAHRLLDPVCRRTDNGNLESRHLPVGHVIHDAPDRAPAFWHRDRAAVRSTCIESAPDGRPAVPAYARGRER
jgi:hypothetical protein